MVSWRSTHSKEVVIDAHVNEVLDRMAAGYHASRDVFAALASEQR
jgi:hypothetical protein